MAQIDWDVGTLLSSGVGALIGSALTLVATYIAHRLQLSVQDKKDAQHLKGLLQSIHDEIETLWDAYMGSAGAHVEALPDGEPVAIYWPITQDYFIIYSANANSIGRVRDHDLRKAIVVAYTKAWGLIDSFRMNNELVHKFEYTTLLYQESKNPVHQAHANAHRQNLVRYAAQLKQRHNDLKAIVSDLLRRLRKEGVLTD